MELLLPWPSLSKIYKGKLKTSGDFCFSPQDSSSYLYHRQSKPAFIGKPCLLIYFESTDVEPNIVIFGPTTDNLSYYFLARGLHLHPVVTGTFYSPSSITLVSLLPRRYLPLFAMRNLAAASPFRSWTSAGSSPGTAASTPEPPIAIGGN